MNKTFYIQVDNKNIVRDAIDYEHEGYIPVNIEFPLPDMFICGTYSFVNGEIIKLIDNEAPNTLEEYKKHSTEQSLKALDVYLNEHPYYSEVKDNILKPYSVGSNDRSLIMGMLIMASSTTESDVPYIIDWSAIGEPCKTWSVEELKQLAYEINLYVKPFITEQKHIESLIYQSTTIEECKEVNIDYENRPYTSI